MSRKSRRHVPEHRRHRNSLLCLGLAATAAAAVPAHALEAPADALGEVVVSGSRPIAESEAAALEVQRNSDSLIAVVAADAVGRLPDQNIAQATSRLPGVGVQRDQGQARYINLRGAPLNWTTLAFDGINVVSPEGRSTRYDNIPSAIASQLIVHKAVTPDMTGETLSGMVEVKTRSAFDYAGFHVAAKAGAGYVQLGGRDEREGSVVLSDRFGAGDGEIGVLLSGSFYERNMVTDNFENDWEKVSQDTQAGNEARYWVHEVENKLYRLTRRNYSGSGRLDWQPSDRSRVFLQSVFTAFTDDEQRDNFRFDLDDRQSSTPTTACNTRTNNGLTVSGGASGYADTCTGNLPYTGSVFGIDIRQRATLRAYEQSIFTTTLGGEHETGAWDVSWRLNYTESVNDRTVLLENSYDSPSTRTLRPTVAYTLSPNRQTLNLFVTSTDAAGAYAKGSAVRDIDQFTRALVSANSLDAVDVTDAYTARIDLGRDLQWFGKEATLKFGARYDDRTKERNEYQLLLNNAQATAAGLSTTYSGLAEEGTAFKGNIPLGYDFKYFSKAKAQAFLGALRTNGSYVELPGNYYDVQEKVSAAYIMATTRYDWGNVVAGVRAEKVDNTAQAYVTLDGASRLVEVGSDHALLFPSLHFNVDVAEDTKLRLSFNSGAARPDYDDLRPNFAVNDSDAEISGGNPQARPERAYGADAYLEWYLQPQGYVMLGAFYKRADDVLFEDSRTFGLDVLNSPTIDRSQYTFSTLTNGGTGYIWGAEFAWQQQVEPFTTRLGLPDWVGGFGIQTNLTFNNSKAEKPDGSKVSFPGTSQTVLNLGAYYEKYGASVRLNYQWRDDWFSEIGDPAEGGDLYWAADGELDFSARYAFDTRWEVYFDASNLTNEAGKRYAGDPSRTIEWERYGARYTLGFRFTR